MYKQKSIIVLIVLLLSCVACNEKVSPARVEVTGVLVEQGITFYQYGSHVMGGYALRSSSVDLDDYVNQVVTVVGYKVEGYPLSGGPELLEVEEVKL